MTTLSTAIALAMPLLQTSPPDQWRAISAEGAPVARSDETAVRAGPEVVIFGGLDAEDRYLGDGAAYDPATDSWRTITTKGAPSPRAWHTAVWTGREMLVWGGDGATEERRDGAAYDPRADRWRPLSEKNAPTARGSHVAIWTGEEMLVWAGVDEEHSFPKGGRYDPVADRWRPFTIDLGKRIPRTLPGVWTGRELLAWGGINGGSVLGHGVASDPLRQESRLIAEHGAPTGRAAHAAVWTGGELVIWGGTRSIYGGRPLGDGARFDPAKNRWRPISAEGGPPRRFGHAFVWTGEELLIIGGATKRKGDALRDAWAWRPEGDWRRLPDLPEPRVHAHAFATGRGVLVIGGRDTRRLRQGGFLLAAGSAKGNPRSKGDRR